MTQFNKYSHLTEKARAIVTARGRPSGTATTKMVTPEMKKPRTSDQCTELSQCSLQHNSERKYSQGQHCQYTKYFKKKRPRKQIQTKEKENSLLEADVHPDDQNQHSKNSDGRSNLHTDRQNGQVMTSDY
jgi:hypothetical protein